MKQVSTPLSFAVALVLAGSAVALGACIGNSSNTCAMGATCVCDGIGNCDQHCPGGDCSFVCHGIGNCNVTCEGGGCALTCSGTGNCILDCTGGNCTSDCGGRGNCICNGCGPLVDSGPRDAGGDFDASSRMDTSIPIMDAGFSEGGFDGSWCDGGGDGARCIFAPDDVGPLPDIGPLPDSNPFDAYWDDP